MVYSIQYELPSHKLFPPKHRKVIEAEKEIVRVLADPRERLSVSYHEAAHALNFRKFGIETRYGGPSVLHDCCTDLYSVSYGSAMVRDTDYLKLAESSERLARVLVAGRVAESVLLGSSVSLENNDFADFLQFARGKGTAELIGIWKRVEEEYSRELSADLNQQREIVHEAARFEEQICGVDRSIREVSNRPAEIAAYRTATFVL